MPDGGAHFFLSPDEVRLSLFSPRSAAPSSPVFKGVHHVQMVSLGSPRGFRVAISYLRRFSSQSRGKSFFQSRSGQRSILQSGGGQSKGKSCRKASSHRHSGRSERSGGNES